MRLISFLLSAFITVVLLYVLNRPWGTAVPMPLGNFLSPQHGFWQNAEDTSKNFSEYLQLPEIKKNAQVYFDERLVPHVFAETDEDLYFIQGYLHAKFRLFQMDLQTRAAEGRASEIAGPIAIQYDKEQRRLGMKYAAEQSLRAMEQNAASRTVYNAYTAGVNAYIRSLKKSDLPIEYKLLNFEPEVWTNLRTALLLKMMAKMLASNTENDIAYTRLKSIFTHDQLAALYPQIPDSLQPIIPKGTHFDSPQQLLKAPPQADSGYFRSSATTIAAHETYTPDKDNGSNNWVVRGTKTEKGAPILCNDPHLELTLPSIWYEMQLSTPAGKSYGVTIPGSPFVIIGFNDSIAWGVTNAQRDVKDYFTIRFKDSDKKMYWYNHAWQPSQQRIEEIKVKNQSPVFDTVAYTVWGPVMYDDSFADTATNHAALAVKWVAHKTGDDGFTFYKLNHAHHYTDYLNAIATYECPGQNFIFASKKDTIAIWQQGRFPARWYGQGLYVMPGEDSSYDWQGFIPQPHNPHAVNPERGYLFSANQRPVDGTYPYFIPGSYITPRANAIEKYLKDMQYVSIADMMALQNNYFNIMAEDMVPVLLQNVMYDALTPQAAAYIKTLKTWNFMADPASAAQTIYQCWFDSLMANIWEDELIVAGKGIAMPEEQTTMELLKRDATALGFVDNKNTPAIENLRTQVTTAINSAAAALVIAEKAGRLPWAKFKNVTIYHLLRTGLLPFAQSGLPMGGWGNIINAVKKTHGPSWRMIAQLNDTTDAYGVYPGGQSGNPGSKFYDNFINSWVAGKYFSLWMMEASDIKNKRIKWTMQFLPKGGVAS